MPGRDVQLQHAVLHVDQSTTKDTTDSLEATWVGGSDCASCYSDQVDTVDLAPAKLALLVLYLLVGTDGVLSTQAAINAISSTAVQAQGLVADGTSAAVAVFMSGSSASVTFTANNGATLRPFSSGFLNSGSGAGAASLSVTPTASGNYYYALALVIGGQPPTAKTGSQITVTAANTGISNTQTQTMLTVPTPVVFIHGLWGDMTSLASTQTYLTKVNSTYKANPFLLTSICYSVYLGFDAATDTLPGHGRGCEQTSTQALDQYLAVTLYPQLAAKHWVGGRVDAVVHSMGGLVVRHYSATANFKSIRNRKLGAFRKVITLDTPETGSALATWLDATNSHTAGEFRHAVRFMDACLRIEPDRDAAKLLLHNSEAAGFPRTVAEHRGGGLADSGECAYYGSAGADYLQHHLRQVVRRGFRLQRRRQTGLAVARLAEWAGGGDLRQGAGAADAGRHPGDQGQRRDRDGGQPDGDRPIGPGGEVQGSGTYRGALSGLCVFPGRRKQ